MIEPNAAAIKSLNEEATLLSRLVNELQELSLAEAGELKLVYQTEDITNLVRQAVTPWQPQLMAGGVAVFAGLAGVWATAASYVPTGVGSFAAVPFGLSACAGSGLVGAGVSGMLLGHWYLIEHDLDLDPLMRKLGFSRACLLAEVACVLVGTALLWLWPGSPWHPGFEALLGGRYGWLVAGRIACWGLAGFLLLLIGKTLAIPQTMAATGLFYIEALVGAVGQILGLWLLFRTGLPL